MVMRECPKCKSLNIDEGYIGSQSLYVHASNNKPEGKILWVPATTKIQSFLCLSCGYVEFYCVDLEKFKSKLPE